MWKGKKEVFYYTEPDCNMVATILICAGLKADAFLSVLAELKWTVL